MFRHEHYLKSLPYQVSSKPSLSTLTGHQVLGLLDLIGTWEELIENATLLLSFIHACKNMRKTIKHHQLFL
ncbi:hypothetical protein ACI8B_210301 [Acinetobacter proteolyticus]|uniref:Uncharacterized protein n=1 Tax=Acinetobacter proteolyticus TaxID=1776741 RepID=A0A653K4L3_9GAMM|nr:hypothetical protein ACI8B_210301 [Acinetobacter proteolyticus]